MGFDLAVYSSSGFGLGHGGLDYRLVCVGPFVAAALMRLGIEHARWDYQYSLGGVGLFYE